MIPPLAQLPSATNDQLLTVILGGFAVLVIADKVHAMWTRGRRSPPLEAEFASKAEVQKIAAEAKADNHALRCDFNDLKAQIKADFDAIQRSGEARAAKIHDRINEILEKVGELMGRCVAFNRRDAK